MQVIKSLKKFAALGTGAVMLGATITGALAADLGDYPAPFVVDGVYDDSNVFVYGDQALADDTAAMLDIAASLQFMAKTAVTDSGSTVTVSGGKADQIPLGQGFSNSTFFDKTLQDDDVSTLFDGAINFAGTEYDTSEELQMCDQTEPFVATSLMTDDDYKRDVFLELGKDKVRYAYSFDESILLNSTTSSNPIEIDFLGKTLKITSISADTSFTATVGEEFTLNAGDSVTVEGKTVVLENVGSSSATISVDGVSKNINEGSTSTVNGIEIYVDSTISRTALDESSAIIVAGLQATETYTDGDAYVGEDTDDPDWVWDIRALNGASGTSAYSDCSSGATDKFILRIENDFDMNDDSDNPTAVGECVNLPNDFLSICIDSLTVADDDYKEVVMEYKSDADLSDANCPNTDIDSSVPALYLSTTASEGFDLRAYTASNNVTANVSSNIKAEEVWLLSDDDDCANSYGSNATTANPAISVFYKALDSPRKVKFFGSFINNHPTNGTTEAVDMTLLRLNIGNTKDDNVKLRVPIVSAASANHTLEWHFVADTTTDLIGSAEDLWSQWDFNANGQFAALGDTLTTEEGEELQWVPGSGRSWTRTNIGTKDEDHRIAYGVIIVDPKGSSSSDKVKMLVPGDQVMANIVVKGESATVSGGSTTYVPTKISPVYMKASEVVDPTMYNLIVVGGPCANSLAASVFDMSCDGWSYAEGEAVVKLVDNGEKVAMLVAGTTALDTQRAGKAIADSSSYAFSGSENMVKGATLQDITVE